MDKENKEKEKSGIKDKVVSAFSLFCLFLVALVVIIIAGWFYDDNKTVTLLNSRFTSINTERQGDYSVELFQEKDTDNIWISVGTTNNGVTNTSGLLRISENTDDVALTYDAYTDCLMITSTITNEKYIYFKDSNTLQTY